MKVDSVYHTHGWYNDGKVVTEYTNIIPDKGIQLHHSQRWYYPVHIYDSKAKIHSGLGRNVDVRI